MSRNSRLVSMAVKPVQVIAVTSGKGGAGKTNVSANLALALADLGCRVVLFDADLTLGAIDVVLGLEVERSLADVISGKCEFLDVLLQVKHGVRIVPAASGDRSMNQLSPMQHAGVVYSFSEIGDSLDFLIIDTAPGISDTVLNFINAAREVLIVVCDEPTSINDSYALIKLLNIEHGMRRFHVLANKTRFPGEGPAVFKKLLNLTEHFLDIELRYAGAVPFDESVRISAQKRRAVYEASPRSKSALAYKKLASLVKLWPLPVNPNGRVEFFVDRLVQRS